MNLSIDLSMTYALVPGDAALLAIEPAETDGQTTRSEQLDIDCAGLRRLDGNDGFGRRFWARVAGDRLTLRYRAEVDVLRAVPRLETLGPTGMPDLPSDTIGYLRPTRYCQSDMFPAFVARRFAGLTGGARIAAIRDWIAEEMAYVPTSTANTTVLDTFAAREGVCRDYAHMVCALARAGGIPARYASVYGPDVTPPDFHAVAQVWLDGGWHLVDASGMGRADQLAIVAVGRDACDTAFMETVQPAQMIDQRVFVTASG